MLLMQSHELPVQWLLLVHTFTFPGLAAKTITIWHWMFINLLPTGCLYRPVLTHLDLLPFPDTLPAFLFCYFSYLTCLLPISFMETPHPLKTCLNAFSQERVSWLLEVAETSSFSDYQNTFFFGICHMLFLHILFPHLCNRVWGGRDQIFLLLDLPFFLAQWHSHIGTQYLLYDIYRTPRVYKAPSISHFFGA